MQRLCLAYFLAGKLVGLPFTHSKFFSRTRLTSELVRGCVAFSRDAVAELAQFVDANSIKPVVAEVFDFKNTVEAFEALQKQTSIGKIAVKIGGA